MITASLNVIVINPETDISVIAAVRVSEVPFKIIVGFFL